MQLKAEYGGSRTPREISRCVQPTAVLFGWHSCSTEDVSVAAEGLGVAAVYSSANMSCNVQSTSSLPTCVYVLLVAGLPINYSSVLAEDPEYLSTRMSCSMQGNSLKTPVASCSHSTHNSGRKAISTSNCCKSAGLLYLNNPTNAEMHPALAGIRLQWMLNAALTAYRQNQSGVFSPS